jgi:hypothetical protein
METREPKEKILSLPAPDLTVATLGHIGKADIEGAIGIHSNLAGHFPKVSASSGRTGF